MSLIERVKAAISQRFGEQVGVPSDLPNQEALASINERSVCREYLETPLSEELVQTLYAIALSAPSKSDLQQATIIRIVSKEKRDAIQRLLPNSAWAAAAPEFWVICGDHSRMQCLFETRGKPYPNDHLDSFFNAAVDGGILLATLIQTAHQAGVGCCPVSEIRDYVDQVSELLNLPKWVFPVAGVTLGYPASMEPLSPRLGLELSVHTDQYDTSGMSEKIADYDRRRNQSRPFSVQRDVDLFGESAEYGWSEDKFRQYSEVQREDFGKYIRKQGFKLD